MRIRLSTVLNALALTIQIAAVVAAAVVIGLSVWFFLEGPAVTPFAKGAAETGRAPPRHIDMQLVSSLQPFGRADEPKVVTDLDSLADTQLNLRLVAVYLSEMDPNQSFALIQSSRSAALSYRVGDRLPGNATLLEIHANSIVLSRSGQAEKLNFKAGKKIIESVELTSVDADLDDSVEQSLLTQSSAQVPIQAATEPAGPKSIASLLEESAGEIRQDPEGFLRQHGVNRVSSTQAAGYQITRAFVNSAAEVTNLEAGDIVLSVNDQPVGGGDDGGLLDSLLNVENAKLEIQRGSRRFFMTVRMK